MEDTTALSVYNEEPEEFPVLKAFQQYIDAEQAKARQRMLSLSIFFGVMLAIVVSVFVYLLINASQRNQQLNDRLLDFVMKERDRQQSSVIVQPQPIPVTPAPQQPAADNAALTALTARLDEIQKNLEATKQQQAEEKDRARMENLEIERLKALLQQERDKAAKEREERREAELEAYRRQHYSYYYDKKEQTKESEEVEKQQVKEEETEEDPIQELLDDLDAKDPGAIKYFDDNEEEDSGDEEEPEDVRRYNRPSWQIPME